MQESNLLQKAKKLQGKRVLITFLDESKVAGEIYFAGYNTFLNFEQVTIDRTPYRISEMLDIEEHIIKNIF